MRIAFIGPFGMEPKSTMRVRALPLAQALVQRDHQVALFLPPFHKPESAGRKWVEEGVTITYLPISRVPLLGYLITAWRLVQAALAWHPQVIHVFKPKGYSGLALWLLWWWWKPAKRPVRLVLDSDDWEGWGGWNDLEKYPLLQKHFFARQEHWGLAHADAITVASRALETIVWSLGVRPKKVFYLPNGPFLPVHCREQMKNSRPPTILLYTRFFEFDVKRIVTLFKGIREGVPGARLLVIGKGLFGEEQQLRAEAYAANMIDAIEYLGWVSAEELPFHFAAANCAIYPFNDTLVNRTKCAVKLCDLLASGVPVVAEAVGQNKETIEHGCSGLLVEPGDDLAFIQAVVQVLNDHELQDQLANGAIERMSTHLNWNLLAEQAEKAYTG